MRKYESPLSAIITRLRHMKEQGILNANEISRRLEGLSTDQACTGHMLRMLVRGDCENLTVLRAMAICKVLGITVEVTDPLMPSEQPVSSGNVATESPAIAACRMLVDMYETHAPDVQGWPAEAYRIARESQSDGIKLEETREQLRRAACKSLVNWWNGNTEDETHPLYNAVRLAGQAGGYGWRTGNVATEPGVSTVANAISADAGDDEAENLRGIISGLNSRLEALADERGKRIDELLQEVERLKQSNAEYLAEIEQRRNQLKNREDNNRGLVIELDAVREKLDNVTARAIDEEAKVSALQKQLVTVTSQLDAAEQHNKILRQRAAAPCGDCADPIAHIVNTLNKTNGNCAVLNLTCGAYAVTVNVRKAVINEAAQG